MASKIIYIGIVLFLQLGFFFYLFSDSQTPNISELGHINISSLKSKQENNIPKETNITQEKEQNKEQDAEEVHPDETINKTKKDYFLNKDGSFYKVTFSNPLPYEDIKTPQIQKESYIPYLELSCYVIDPDHLNVIIRDANKVRFEIPNEDPYPHAKNPQYLPIEESNFELVTQQDSFNVIIKRKATHEIIFNLVDRFVYTDLYLEFTFVTPTKEIYGLGLRLSPLQFKPGTYSLFLLDRAGMIDHGKSGFNGQGHHPMYLMKEKSGKYHTFLLRNINMGEVTIYENQKIRWQLIGGVIDLNFFLGDTPEAAVEKYHEYCDGWAMPAFWHLGYHQNKWGGYHDINALANVIKGFEDKNIPLDVLWTDADQMINNINFSIDENRYPLDQVNELFKTHRKKWIPIFDPYVTVPLSPPVVSYPKLDELFLRDEHGEICKGTFIWGRVYFIDFFHPMFEKFWDDMIWENDKKWKLSGLWLDANEVTNLKQEDHSFRLEQMSNHKYFNLPFYPSDVNLYALNIINLDCVHANGQEEFNIRSMNVIYQTKTSYASLKKKFPYPFVLSRATVFGGAKYAFTWIPDVLSNWESLKVSTGVLLNYGMFGYPMSGSDVCGFTSAVKVEGELCARWYQIAVFYPFARNSHVIDFQHRYNFQEPYLFGGDYFKSIYQAIQLRYSLLKYFYAVFFSKRSHGTERKVGTLFRPLFFDFHNDTNLPPYGHNVHETQILFGEAIMVATIPYQKTWQIDVYIPNHRWFDLRSFEEVPVRGKMLYNASGILTEPMPYYLKAGHILMTQNVTGISNSDDLSNIFTLIIGLSDATKTGEIIQSSAQGKILGISSYQEEYVYDRCTLDNCILVINANFEMHGSSKPILKLEANGMKKNSLLDSIQVNEIILMGVPLEVQQKTDHITIEGLSGVEVEMEKIRPGTFKLKVSELILNGESLLRFIFQ